MKKIIILIHKDRQKYFVLLYLKNKMFGNHGLFLLLFSLEFRTDCFLKWLEESIDQFIYCSTQHYTWQFIALLIYRDKAIKILVLSRENDKNAIKFKIIFLFHTLSFVSYNVSCNTQEIGIFLNLINQLGNYTNVYP